jgi:hypothetical protein
MAAIFSGGYAKGVPNLYRRQEKKVTKLRALNTTLGRRTDAHSRKHTQVKWRLYFQEDIKKN